MARAPLTVAARPPASRAQVLARRKRFKRWVERSKAGVAIAPTPFTADTVTVLVNLGYLDDDHASTQQIGAAIAAAMASLVRRT